MNATIEFACKNCVDGISFDIEIDGKNMPSLRDFTEKAREQGWHFGRDCYCPDCYSELPAHCNTCEHYEGNKSMGAPVCRRDNKFAAPTDCCDYHKPIHGDSTAFSPGYKNPIPTLNKHHKE